MSPSPQNFPALFSALAQTILALVIATGLTSLTTAQVGIIEAAVAAAAGLVVAVMVHQGAVPALTGLVNALITAGVAFGIPHISAGLTSSVDAFIVAIAAFFVHQSVSPKTRPAPVL